MAQFIVLGFSDARRRVALLDRLGSYHVAECHDSIPVQGAFLHGSPPPYQGTVELKDAARGCVHHVTFESVYRAQQASDSSWTVIRQGRLSATHQDVTLGGIIEGPPPRRLGVDEPGESVVTMPVPKVDVFKANSIGAGAVGYQGVHKRPEAAGPAWHVAMRAGLRRKLNPFIEPDFVAERVEKMKASIRAKVEHPFRVIKRQFGFTKVRYRGLAKNTAQNLPRS